VTLSIHGGARFGTPWGRGTRVAVSLGMKTMSLSVSVVILVGLGGCIGAPAYEEESGAVRGRTCQPDDRYPYLCTNVPDDGRFALTSYGGENDDSESNGRFACGGGYPDGWSWYATSWVRWGCGAKLEVQADGRCAVVEVKDAGPAAWVERDAGMPILDASPRVCQELFGTSSCGWSDGFVVKVTEVDERTPVGPARCSNQGRDDRWNQPDPQRQRDDNWRQDQQSWETWGSCTSSQGAHGICVDAGACRSRGGYTERFRCPGPNEIQCCLR